MRIRGVALLSASTVGAVSCVALLTVAVGANPTRKCEHRVKIINYYTPAQVQRIEQRLPKLKPGMTRTQVFQTLGYNLMNKVGAMSGGPTTHYLELYPLRNGRNPVLYFDHTKQPPRFRSAKLLKFNPR